jgi:hypothetical protein
MITGIALLGVLAGALANFFGLDKDALTSSPPSETATLDVVLAEVRQLWERLDQLQVTGEPAPPSAGAPDRSGG